MPPCNRILGTHICLHSTGQYVFCVYIYRYNILQYHLYCKIAGTSSSSVVCETMYCKYVFNIQTSQAMSSTSVQQTPGYTCTFASTQQASTFSVCTCTGIIFFSTICVAKLQVPQTGVGAFTSSMVCNMVRLVYYVSYLIFLLSHPV